MNVDELQSVRNRERQTDSLQQLSDTFYQDAGEFIQELKRERSRVAGEVEDPFDSADVRRLTDEIKTAESTVESIYERRVGKIVKQASLEAAGMPAGADGLTAEELELFERLVAAIEDNREHVLEGLLAGGGGLECTDTTNTVEPASDTAPAPAADPSPETPDRSGTAGVSAADAMGAGSDPASGGDADDRARVPPDSDPAGDPDPDADSGSEPEPAASYPAPAGDEADDIERATVRITDDVGEIYGVDDRSYELSREDVVTLPSVNAGPLVERGAAERLD